MEPTNQSATALPMQNQALPPLGSGSLGSMPMGASSSPMGAMPPMPSPAQTGDSGILQLKIPFICFIAGLAIGLLFGLFSGSASTPAQLAQQVGLAEDTYFVDEDNGDINIWASAFNYYSDSVEKLFDRCGFDGSKIINEVYTTTQLDGEQVRTAGKFSIVWKIRQGQLSYCWILKE